MDDPRLPNYEGEPDLETRVYRLEQQVVMLTLLCHLLKPDGDHSLAFFETPHVRDLVGQAAAITHPDPGGPDDPDSDDDDDPGEDDRPIIHPFKRPT